MKIVIDIGHPAHVHFFKYFIGEMRARGHQVLITAAQKEINLDLLKSLEISYVYLGQVGKGLLGKLISLFVLNFKMYKAVKDFKPDLFMGIASIRAAQVSWLMGKKSIIFDDTEESPQEQWLYRPFSTEIYSPTCFKKNFGKNHKFYPGYHELAYLHPDRFEPRQEVVSSLGLKFDEKLFVIRFISWGAVHDIGHQGFSYEGKKELIKFLSQYGRVVITSEIPLLDEFEPYRLSICPTKIHDLLSYADLYVGEGATMASEAAVLGTPVIYMRTLVHGYLQELQDKYEILYSFKCEQRALKKIKQILMQGDQETDWQLKRQRILDEKIDVTSFMLNLVEKKEPIHV